MLFDGELNYLDLLGDSGQLHLKQSVELVEASPGATLDETDEDATHRLVVQAFVTIEDEHLATEVLTKSFH